jgi:hypothetical protein
MATLESLIEPYEDWVKNNPELIGDVSQLVLESCEGAYTHDEIMDKLNDLVKIDMELTIEEPVIQREKVIKPKINASRFQGMARSERDRTMNLLNHIDSVVQKNPQGLTKTQLLNLMRKNNSHWRAEIGTLLAYLVADNVVLTDSKKYFPYNVVIKSRERELHRRIYELLSNGSMNMTQIYIKTGTNGGKSRKYVREAIMDLNNEGYIVQENRRWRWS